MDTLSIHSKLNCLSCLLTNLCLTAPWTFCSVETNHFRPLANSFRFNLLFLAPPGCQVPSWHSSSWQPTTFGPWPTHFISPCFPKTCISWIPLDAQCPSGILHCGKQPLLAPCHLIAVPLAFQKTCVSWPLLGSQCPPGTFLCCGSQPLSAPGQLFSFHLTSQKTCVSWLPLGAKCLPGTFLCVCGRPPLSAPGQLILFPLAFQKIVFLGSPWVLSALLALFFIVTNHFWPLANSLRFTLLSKSLYFLASSGYHVPFLHSSSDSSAFCQYSLQPGTPKTNSWACVIFKKILTLTAIFFFSCFSPRLANSCFNGNIPFFSCLLAPQCLWLLKPPGFSNSLAPQTSWLLQHPGASNPLATGTQPPLLLRNSLQFLTAPKTQQNLLCFGQASQ